MKHHYQQARRVADGVVIGCGHGHPTAYHAATCPYPTANAPKLKVDRIGLPAVVAVREVEGALKVVGRAIPRKDLLALRDNPVVRRMSRRAGRVGDGVVTATDPAPPVVVARAPRRRAVRMVSL